VRFISNHSSGKMGYALAGSRARSRRRHVILVSAPTARARAEPVCGRCRSEPPTRCSRR
jgi:phosphopantothenoylcysteine synthetase/decarboxylase